MAAPLRTQPRQGPVHLAHCDNPIERHHRVVHENRHLVMPLQNLRPVRLLGTRRVGEQRGNDHLRLVLPDSVPTQRPPQDRDSHGDRRRVPPRAVLPGERHQRAVRGALGGTASVMEQQG